MKRSVVEYQAAKADVTDAILAVKGCAERMEKTPTEEFGSALYDLLDAIDYLDRIFTDFAYDNIPEMDSKETEK